MQKKKRAPTMPTYLHYTPPPKAIILDLGQEWGSQFYELEDELILKIATQVKIRREFRTANDLPLDEDTLESPIHGKELRTIGLPSERKPIIPKCPKLIFEVWAGNYS